MMITAAPQTPTVTYESPDLEFERVRLLSMLGGVRLDVVDRLYAHGIRASHLSVLEWLPAVDVCWIDGADVAERHAMRLQYISDDRSTPQGLAVLDAWLETRPAPDLLSAGRIALVAWLAAIDDDSHDEMIDRIVGRCEAAGRAAGGDFGISALSPAERQHIERVKRYLLLPF